METSGSPPSQPACNSVHFREPVLSQQVFTCAKNSHLLGFKRATYCDEGVERQHPWPCFGERETAAGKLRGKSCLSALQVGRRSIHLPTPKSLNTETVIPPTTRPRYNAIERSKAEAPTEPGGKVGNLTEHGIQNTHAKHLRCHRDATELCPVHLEGNLERRGLH